jgi:hypothetical protein
MRQSARRIRSLIIRHAIAETLAFPGIRTDWPCFPYNEKPAQGLRSSRPHPLGNTERLVYRSR